MAVSSSFVRPFSAIPGPKRWPFIGTSLDMITQFGKWHLLNEKRNQMYGPIWREEIPQFGDVVVIADARGVRDLARAVDQNPTRTDTPIWVDYYKTRGLPLGIMHANDHDWQRMRKVVDKPILRPAYIGREVPKLTQVSKEFVSHLGQLRLPSDGLVPSINEELFKWALESSSVILYGCRLGCLNGVPPQITTDFIRSVQDVMKQMVELLLVPPFILKTVMKPTWHEYLKNWDTIFRIAQASVQGKVATGNIDMSETSTFIKAVVSSNAMSMEEMFSNMSELMMASVDTTASTAQTVLFELARRPDVQKKIHLEICQHLPEERHEITYDHLLKLPYLKGTIKECQRLYPVAFNVTRRLLSDTVICGYHIPKQTVAIVALYPLGRNPDFFKDPCQLRPERWLRGEESLVSDPFAFIPFGLGQRSCVGKRMANVQLELFICELLRHYKVSSSTDEMQLINKFILTPKEPVQVKLTPRTS